MEDVKRFLAACGDGTCKRQVPKPSKLGRGRPRSSEVIRAPERLRRIAEGIAQARARLGLSVYGLSVGTGLGYRTVLRLEKGVCPASLPVLRLVCSRLGLDLAELVGPGVLLNS